MSLLTQALLFLLGTSLTHAASQPVVIKRHTVVREVYEGTSEANRLRKKLTIAANLLGVGPGLSKNQGLSVGYQLTPDSLIIGEFHNSDGYEWRSYTSSNGIVTTSGASRTQHQGIGVHYKQFTSNSFYFRTGLDIMDMSYRYNRISASGADSSYDSKFNANVGYANFTIGNQWQWDNLTVGCDWVGLVAPIFSKLNGRSITGSPDTYDISNFEDDIGLYTQNSTLLALRFYIGASF